MEQVARETVTGIFDRLREDASRPCGKCGGPNDRWPQRRCRLCHAEDMREWRKANPIPRTNYRARFRDGVRYCPRCRDDKTDEDFFPSRPDMCKRCCTDVVSEWRKQNPEANWQHQRRAHLKQYGLTEMKFEAMWDDQNGQCAVCAVPMTRKERGKGLRDTDVVVDHDHGTNQVRGLTCSRCNRGLGAFGDSLLVLQQAVSYLERST